MVTSVHIKMAYDKIDIDSWLWKLYWWCVEIPYLYTDEK
jgi:hypothetical protein